ncbi:phage DNA packaging protein J [Sphingobium sp. 15-1]
MKGSSRSVARYGRPCPPRGSK